MILISGVSYFHAINICDTTCLFCANKTNDITFICHKKLLMNDEKDVKTEDICICKYCYSIPQNIIIEI